MGDRKWLIGNVAFRLIHTSLETGLSQQASSPRIDSTGPVGSRDAKTAEYGRQVALHKVGYRC